MIEELVMLRLLLLTIKGTNLLNWYLRNIEDMCVDGWLWQQNIKDSEIN